MLSRYLGFTAFGERLAADLDNSKRTRYGIPTCSTQWLEARLTDPHLVLLDASMETVIGKEPLVYDEPICIPRSRRFDLENVFCDKTSTQIHALPTFEQFSQGIAQLGD